MFSAIANFFFGGDKTAELEEQLDEAVECFTKEAEDADWLLVDVSDQEEADPSSIDKENLLPEEEEDILSSLPYLLGLDGYRDQPLKVMYSEDQLMLTPSSCLVSEVLDENITGVLPVMRFAVKPALGQVCRSSVFATLFDSFVNIELKPTGDSIVVKSAFARTEKKLLPICVRRGPKRKSIQGGSCKSKADKQDKHQSHPAELAGPFLNHQPSPVLLSKNDHLQQIKDLKPAQQAKEYKLKKRHNRNQLNRQNKVYLYESSNKNQHRRDLWCRHSGANNNRKCY